MQGNELKGWLRDAIYAILALKCNVIAVFWYESITFEDNFLGTFFSSALLVKIKNASYWPLGQSKLKMNDTARFEIIESIFIWMLMFRDAQLLTASTTVLACNSNDLR